MCIRDRYSSSSKNFESRNIQVDVGKIPTLHCEYSRETPFLRGRLPSALCFANMLVGVVRVELVCPDQKWLRRRKKFRSDLVGIVVVTTSSFVGSRKVCFLVKSGIVVGANRRRNRHSCSNIIVAAAFGCSCCRMLLTAICLSYTSPSPRDLSTSRMPSSA